MESSQEARVDPLLSQEEIDSLFSAAGSSAGAMPYDFRRPDRIPKDQLRAVQSLHENFARNLASSLSACLRAYVVVNLISIEQLTCAEFLQSLPSPTCLAWLGMEPFGGRAVLELNTSLVFPMLEKLLGGSGAEAGDIRRELTEIEQTVLEGIYRIILHDLEEAWRPVAAVRFSLEARAAEAQLLPAAPLNEALLAVGLEVRVGEQTGMMNIAVPSAAIKTLGASSARRGGLGSAEAGRDQQVRILRLIQSSLVEVDARLEGPTLLLRDLLKLEPGDVLKLDHPTGKPASLLINGKCKFRGQIRAAGPNRAFLIE